MRPCVLLAGPRGAGRTTAAHLLCYGAWLDAPHHTEALERFIYAPAPERTLLIYDVPAGRPGDLEEFEHAERIDCFVVMLFRHDTLATDVRAYGAACRRANPNADVRFMFNYRHKCGISRQALAGLIADLRFTEPVQIVDFSQSSRQLVAYFDEVLENITERRMQRAKEPLEPAEEAAEEEVSERSDDRLARVEATLVSFQKQTNQRLERIEALLARILAALPE